MKTHINSFKTAQTQKKSSYSPVFSIKNAKKITHSGHTASPGKEHSFTHDTPLPRLQQKKQPLGKSVNSPALLFLPLYNCSVSAGFPSPAEEWADYSLDLNQHLIQNAPATFFVRASGDSMQNVGIFDGDLLIVDRSRNAKSQDIVIVSVNGDLTVKRLIAKKGKNFLKAENEGFSSIELTEDTDVHIWGVVTYVVHDLHT